MAVFDDIARALAANLAAIDGFQVSPYFLDHPTPDTLQVSGVEDIEYDVAFQNGARTHDMWNIEVEACILRSDELRAQQLLAELLSPDGPKSVKAAIEADPSNARLTKRFLDDLTISTGNDPACDDLHVFRYRGNARHQLDDGTAVMLAIWSVQVLT